MLSGDGRLDNADWTALVTESIVSAMMSSCWMQVSSQDVRRSLQCIDDDEISLGVSWTPGSLQAPVAPKSVESRILELSAIRCGLARRRDGRTVHNTLMELLQLGL